MFRRKNKDKDKGKKDKLSDKAQSVGDKFGKVVDKTVAGAKKEAEGSKNTGEKVVKSAKGGGTVLASEIGKGSKKLMKNIKGKMEKEDKK